MPPDTRTLILDTAERLFARDGFKSTSTRKITREAGINLAAVNYHFGSKERLIQEVFARRVGPVNERRLRLLDHILTGCEQEDRAPRLEELLRAFIEPAIEVMHQPGGQAILGLFSRLMIESRQEIARLFVEQFAQVARRFLEALHDALPHLETTELSWRMHFMIGAMAHTMAEPFRLEFLSDGRCNPDDVEATTRRLVAFCAAGFRSEDPDGGEKKTTT